MVSFLETLEEISVTNSFSRPPHMVSPLLTMFPTYVMHACTCYAFFSIMFCRLHWLCIQYERRNAVPKLPKGWERPVVICKWLHSFISRVWRGWLESWWGSLWPTLLWNGKKSTTHISFSESEETFSLHQYLCKDTTNITFPP